MSIVIWLNLIFFSGNLFEKIEIFFWIGMFTPKSKKEKKEKEGSKQIQIILVHLQIDKLRLSNILNGLIETRCHRSDLSCVDCS